MLTGQLRECPFAALLNSLYRDKFTGELGINATLGFARLYFRDGYPVFADVPDKTEIIGKVLRDIGAMDAAKQKRSLALAAGPKQRFGELLLLFGLCDREALRGGLRTQVARRVLPLFAQERGSYAASPGDHKLGMEGNESLAVHPYWLIHRGARTLTGERLQALLPPLSETALSITLSSAADLGAFGLPQREAHAAGLLLHGRFAFNDLLTGAGLPPASLLALLYALHVTGMLVVAPTETATDRPPPPPLLMTSDDDRGIPPALNASSNFDAGAMRRPAAQLDPALLRAEIVALAAVLGDPRVDLYTLLGVSSSAGPAAIEEAALAASIRFAPDRLQALALGELGDAAQRILGCIREAREILCEPDRRRSYGDQRRISEAEFANAKADPSAAARAQLAFVRGCLRLETLDYLRAALYFDESVNLQPKSGEYLAHRAWASYRAGSSSVRDALSQVVKAMRIATENPAVFYFAGVLYKDAGDVDRALRCFGKVRKLDSKHVPAASEMRLLEARRARGAQSSSPARAEDTGAQSRPGTPNGPTGPSASPQPDPEPPKAPEPDQPPESAEPTGQAGLLATLNQPVEKRRLWAALNQPIEGRRVWAALNQPIGRSGKSPPPQAADESPPALASSASPASGPPPGPASPDSET